MLIQVFGVDANDDVGESTGDELVDGVLLGIGERYAPVSGVGKAAFVEVLDGGENVLSFSNQQHSQRAADRLAEIGRWVECWERWRV